MQYFLDNEKNSIYNIIKQRIINISLAKKNIYNFRDFNDKIEIYIFDKNEIQRIFEEMTYKKNQNDGQILFSLKNEFIRQFDIDYILSPSDISNSQKYIIDFKKEYISLFNNYFYETF